MTWRQTAIVAATEDRARDELVLRGSTSQRLEELEAEQNQEHTTECGLGGSLEVGHRQMSLMRLEVWVTRSEASSRTITAITKISRIWANAIANV